VGNPNAELLLEPLLLGYRERLGSCDDTPDGKTPEEAFPYRSMKVKRELAWIWRKKGGTVRTHRRSVLSSCSSVAPGEMSQAFSKRSKRTSPPWISPR
jgi:hypothetical protein